MNDDELARRSILGFGEVIAALGRWGVGEDAVVRRADALGARIPAVAGNPWFDAVVVPPGTAPPADDPLLPGCVWTPASSVSGRVEDPAIATPCLGITLDDPALVLGGSPNPAEAPPLAVLGELNERAYGEAGWFVPIVGALRDARVRTYGLREGDAFVCVALTMDVGDDLSIHYVATEDTHRRRGLASRLVRDAMATARARGMRSATLQASADGLPVWKRLGFRQVATLRGYVRDAP
ncbi:GNAT family N-acetyltransferase [Roseomonas rosulenta]|uniref:GNAT family N-acetyltransferase n=1 Tax=Roseomonas rosulenta TaxID=2748667 RepID=UPI0018DFA76F|nr:GNAT family N-acetyltransferase [Roseomonas rosulenta]